MALASTSVEVAVLACAYVHVFSYLRFYKLRTATARSRKIPRANSSGYGGTQAGFPKTSPALTGILFDPEGQAYREKLDLSGVVGPLREDAGGPPEGGGGSAASGGAGGDGDAAPEEGGGDEGA